MYAKCPDSADWISRDLKIAEDYEILSEDQLSITPYKGDTLVYKKLGEQLMLEKDGEQSPVADYIDYLKFESMSDGSKIDIKAEKNSYEVNLSTKVKNLFSTWQ